MNTGALLKPSQLCLRWERAGGSCSVLVVGFLFAEDAFAN